MDCVQVRDLMDIVRSTVKRGARSTILYVNVHCMNARRSDPAYGAILERADVVYCDGTGVRLAARLRRLQIPARTTAADWIHDLCRLALKYDLSLFLLGSVEGVASEAALALRTRYPGLRVVGTGSGFDADTETVERINSAHPDILLVGMGTPTQEKWIDEYRDRLDVPVIWAVGALFEFVSGRIRRGPRWMTDHGMEWMCRLAAEPSKLWRRYLFGNPWFFWRVVTGADR